MMDRESEQSELQGDMMAHAEQVLTALPVIQAFGREVREGERFEQTTNRVGGSYLRSIATGLQFRVSTGAALAAGTALLVASGGRHVLEGRILLGDLLIFLNYLAYLYVPLETIAYLSMSFASGRGRSASRLRIDGVRRANTGSPGCNTAAGTRPGAGNCHTTGPRELLL